MAQGLTMKRLSEEMETLREHLHELEADFERKLEVALEKAAGKLKARTDGARGALLQVQRSGEAVDAGARRRLIAETAYFRAERRGFCGGTPEEDWLEAEREIDRLILEGWTKTAAGELPGAGDTADRGAGGNAPRVPL